MGTRGFIGFAVDGELKVAYNHWDSHPDSLGRAVLHWVSSADLAKAREAALTLRVVREGEEPTAADIERLEPWTDTTVGGHRDRPSWYQLLRGTQGSPSAILEAGSVEDASDFPLDSLFAEYGYVVDFDEQRLEAYVGFQQQRHSSGRFAREESNRDGYYPVKLAASWPLTELPSQVDFEAAVEEAESND